MDYEKSTERNVWIFLFEIEISRRGRRCWLRARELSIVK